MDSQNKLSSASLQFKSNTQKNPAYYMALAMLRNAPKVWESVRGMKAAMPSEARCGPRWHLKDKALEDPQVASNFESIKDVIREVCAACPTTPPATPHPKPPPGVIVLNNFEPGTKVIDIGTGPEGKRNWGVGLDIEVYEEKGHPVDQGGIPYKNHGKFESPEERVITSFNSLTNNKNQDCFVESDGLHVIPDLPYFLEKGLSVENDEGEILTEVIDKDGKLDMYVDYPCDIPSVRISKGYRALATFKKRGFKIEFTSKGKVKGFKRPDDFIWRPSNTCYKTRPKDDFYPTSKADGMLCRLVCKGGRALLFYRDGRCYKGAYDGPNMDLWLERVEDKFHLLKIVRYRNFGLEGFFCHAKLHKYFCDRVNIELDGTPILGFEEIDLTTLTRDAAPEGIVVRGKNKKGYFETAYKWVETFDLKYDMANELLKLCEGMGYIVTGVFRDGVWEYEVIHRDKDLTFVPVRKRQDDNQNELTQKSLTSFLSRMTLTEYLVVQGFQE